MNKYEDKEAEINWKLHSRTIYTKAEVEAKTKELEEAIRDLNDPKKFKNRGPPINWTFKIKKLEPKNEPEYANMLEWYQAQKKERRR